MWISDASDTQIIGNVLRPQDPVILIDGQSAGYVVRENDVAGGVIDHPGTGTVE